MSPEARTYESALRIINSRKRGVRPSPSKPPPGRDAHPLDPSGTPDLRGNPSIVGMREWLDMLGYSLNDIDKLNVIHVAGTKGKGSTCAFTESFLRSHGRRTGSPRKTGLYTSPHLIVPEERIRINSKPLARDLFAKYFFEIYDKLPQLARPYDADAGEHEIVQRGPRNLQLFALLAFHVFYREEVDVAIIETHHGGEYDATNVIQHPLVTAITTLGMDHIDQLGPTIENIAWHKSGIFKNGAVALSTTQDQHATQLLKSRASDKGCKLQSVPEDARLPADSTSLQVKVQRKNASLALAAADAFLKQLNPITSSELSEEDIRIGVEQWSWPGRFQVIPDGNRTWFLDAAHNELSVGIAVEWFAEAGARISRDAERVLVFSHVSQTRDATGLLRTLAAELKSQSVEVSHVVLTTYTDSHSTQTVVDPALKDAWLSVCGNTTVLEEATIRRAMSRVIELCDDSPRQEFQILLTGSQHLVGPALRILQEHNAAR